MDKGVSFVEAASLAPVLISLGLIAAISFVGLFAYGWLDATDGKISTRFVDGFDIAMQGIIVPLLVLPAIGVLWATGYEDYNSGEALAKQAEELKSHYGVEVEWTQGGSTATNTRNLSTYGPLSHEKPVAVSIIHDGVEYDGAAVRRGDEVRLLAATYLDDRELVIQWENFDLDNIDGYLQNVPANHHIAATEDEEED